MINDKTTNSQNSSSKITNRTLEVNKKILRPNTTFNSHGTYMYKLSTIVTELCFKMAITVQLFILRWQHGQE